MTDALKVTASLSYRVATLRNDLSLAKWRRAISAVLLRQRGGSTCCRKDSPCSTRAGQHVSTAGTLAPLGGEAARRLRSA